MTAITYPKITIFSCLIKIVLREIIKLFDTYKQFENMCLEMMVDHRDECTCTNCHLWR